jgi:hypothetical protein
MNHTKLYLASELSADSQAQSELKIELYLEKCRVIPLYSFLSDNNLPKNFFKGTVLILCKTKTCFQKISKAKKHCEMTFERRQSPERSVPNGALLSAVTKMFFM